MRNLPHPILLHRPGELSRNHLIDWLGAHQKEIYLRACLDDPQAVKLVLVINRAFANPSRLALLYLLACIDEYRQVLLN